MRIGLFAGDQYYPSRAMEDFYGEFPSQEEALKVATEFATVYRYRFEWYQIVNLDSMVILNEGTNK